MKYRRAPRLLIVLRRESGSIRIRNIIISIRRRELGSIRVRNKNYKGGVP